MGGICRTRRWCIRGNRFDARQVYMLGAENSGER